MSQPNVIVESSQVEHNIRFQDPRIGPTLEFVLFLRKHLHKKSQNAKENVVKVLAMKMKLSFVLMVQVPGQTK